MVRVRIPASTANLGSGFDTLGLALTLHNEVALEAAPGTSIEVEGEGREELLLQGEEHLVLRAARATFRHLGLEPPCLRIWQRNAIPLGRGLGSSAAACLGGIAGAAAIAGRELPAGEILRLAMVFEGHPDNITAALLGGLTVAALADETIRYVRMAFPPEVRAVAVIPDFHLPTAKARAALPATVPFGDAVFNLNRAALLVAALATGELDQLAEAVKDRLHQPYRAPLVPGFAAVLEEAEGAGALGCFLSGAGPTIIALARGEGTAIGDRMVERWRREAGVAARRLVLDVDRDGLRVT